jgi:hypothetical protein
MQHADLRRNARRALARLTRACAFALERFATRVEPGRARQSKLSDDQPPQHWLEDIQQHGGALEWVRFSIRDRSRSLFPRERRPTIEAAPRPVTPQPTDGQPGLATTHDAAPERLKFTLRRQPTNTPARARPATQTTAEPRLTLRYGPRPVQPAPASIERRFASAEGERGDRLQRGRPATGAAEQQPPAGAGHTSPPFALDSPAPADLFPDWPVAIETEQQPARTTTRPDRAPQRTAQGSSTTPAEWRPLTWPLQAIQPANRGAADASATRAATPAEQPWPALPDRAPDAAGSESTAWELTRSRREEQHLRRLEHEQRGEPWSEWHS